MLRVLFRAALIAAGVVIVAGSASATRAISTDARRPPQAIPGVANSKAMAMFLYSNTPNADTITLGDVSSNPVPPAIFCTAAIAATCAASAPGDVAILGQTGPHGDLPVGIPVPFDLYFDTGLPIYSSGPVQLVLTNTTACAGGISPCTFGSDEPINIPEAYESGQVLMNWVLPCPTRFYDPAAPFSVPNSVETADICGATSDPWATFAFPGAPSLSDLVGAADAALLTSKYASGQLYFVAFQDTVADPTLSPNPYTYDDAVIAVWFEGAQAVPEPLTLSLFAVGLLGLAMVRCKHERRI